MVVVGAYARIDGGDRDSVVRRLNALPGVETFCLQDPARVGLVIEGDDVDRAHEKLTREVRAVQGVRGVWPVFMHDETGPEEA